MFSSFIGIASRFYRNNLQPAAASPETSVLSLILAKDKPVRGISAYTVPWQDGMKAMPTVVPTVIGLFGLPRHKHIISYHIILTISSRKFRSQTSDDVDRWKSRGGKSQRREAKRREEQRRSEKRKGQKSQIAVFFLLWGSRRIEK